MKSVGENIKAARIKAGLTQLALAEKMGTSQQVIAAYENDKRNPKIETLEKIAEALNVQITRLLDTGWLKMSKDLVDLFAGKGGIELVQDYTELHELYDQLNETGQQKAIEHMDMLTKIPEYTNKE